MCSIQKSRLLAKSFRNIIPRETFRVVTGHRSYANIPTISSQYTKDDMSDFKALFADIRTDMMEISKEYEDKFIPGWFDKCLSYTVNAGKMNRGQLTVAAFKLLALGPDLTAENLRMTQYVGWMSEIFQATFFIVDDISDGNEIRRNMPCWHTLPEVKMNSINDILWLENGTFLGLKKYIGHMPYYPKVFKMFTEALFTTSLGQTLDYLVTKDTVANQSMNRYESIVKYKTCIPAFYMPVALGLIVSGYTDPRIYEEAKKALYDIGLFFQSRNDYLDCFGEFEETGKEGTDIQKNKLSWMAVRAMERVDSFQRKTMETCYGQKDPEKVAQVLKLYKDIEVDKQFLEYEKESYGRISNMIEDLRFDTLKPVLHLIWNVIYHKKSL